MQTIIAPPPTERHAAFGDERLLERFWSKVRQNTATGCWEWTAQIGHNGYGRFQVKGSSQRAHRIAYEALVCPIPEGLVIDHLCRVRHCVNPSHLEAVTPAENNRRGGAGLTRRTHCPAGHPYDEANTAVSAKGKRRCKACTHARKGRYRRGSQESQELTPPLTEFVDKDGDVWVPSGYNGRGELELICPNPQDPREDGEGEPRRWSLHGVQSAFGPLIARSAVSS